MTTRQEWQDWLVRWNAELLERIDASLERRLAAAGITLEAHLGRYGVTPQVRASGWLGRPGAAAEQLAQLEDRLGKALPPSYRALLEASNGFLQPGMLVPRLLPVEEVDWFAANNRSTIEALRPFGDMSDILAATLQISAREIAGTAVYLLNPRKVTADGEWEVLKYAHWADPNIRSHESLWAMMQYEYRFSVLYCERGEGCLASDDDERAVQAKLPFLVRQLERKLHSLAHDPYLAHMEGRQAALAALEAAADRVRGLQEGRTSGVLRHVEALFREVVEKQSQRKRIHYPGGGFTEVADDGTRHGWAMAQATLGWFLNGRRA
jgi:hypothetical protein